MMCPSRISATLFPTEAKLKKQQQTEQDLQDQVTKWVDRADQDWQVLTDLKQLLEDGSNTPDLRQTQNLQGRAKELQKYLKDNEQYKLWLGKDDTGNEMMDQLDKQFIQLKILYVSKRIETILNRKVDSE
eukprot:GHVU01055223.1.p1 GENE.GHVU01055223.1~~GHVU01055223.1.p1  ORF type:complete len:130 (-),score=22.35 GHVU01055223.1:89-478(-)